MTTPKWTMPTEEDFANWVKDPMWPHPTMLGPEIKAIYAWFSARMKPVTPSSKVLEESLSEVIQKSSEIKEQFLKTFLACHVDASTTVETLKAIFDNWALAEQRDGTVIKWFMVPRSEMKPVTIAPLDEEELKKLSFETVTYVDRKVWELGWRAAEARILKGEL